MFKKFFTLSGLRMVEFFHLGLLLWWGVCLLMPVDTFNAANYAAMKRLASEETWGSIALFMGVGQAFAMTGKFERLMPFGFALCSFFWIFIATMLMINNFILKTVTTGSGVYLLVSLLVLWLSFNVGSDKR